MRPGVCLPFSGFAGRLLMCAVALLSLLVCVVRYFWKHRSGKDRRPVRVYAYDMSKIGISQSAAWLVNLLVTDGVFQGLVFVDNGEDTARLGIEGIGWYSAIFVLDTFVGVPMGIWFGKLWMRWADERWNSYVATTLALSKTSLIRANRNWSVMSLESIDDDALQDVFATNDVPPNEELPCVPRWAEQNRIYGKYGRQHTDSARDVYVDRWGPQLDFSWWVSQTISWSACVALSRFASGMVVVIAIVMLPPVSNPLVWIAQTVTDLPLTCGQKQWLIAGATRIAIDVLQFLVIDAVNRFRSKEDHVSLSPCRSKDSVQF